MTPLSRVLVANRGEIAARIVRACFDEGIESVLAASSVDMESLPARLADRVVCIGPPAPSASYLDVGRIVTAAVATGCDAVHPGYGFLSEQPELARACAENGLVFVGPSIDSLQRGGDKLLARRLARELGIPLSAGSEAVEGVEAGLELAGQVGYPLIVKAAAGGGGRGMRLIEEGTDLAGALEQATSEAREAFGDGRLFIERFVGRARHIEVQVLGDRFGKVVHLGERDCSIQRRYQKLIEEAPAPGLADDLRARLCRDAVRFAEALGYVGAGTVEFLVDVDRDEHFFLEMNTRVQVEHPVTEAVTGVDVVRQQLRIAAGEPLHIDQTDVAARGHAVEFRLTAEDAARDFAPSPGLLSEWVMPAGEGIRVDTHCFPGYTVPPYYDSLLAKLIVWGPDRATALVRADRALAKVRVGGVPTTTDFHRTVVANDDFQAGRVTTRWVETTLLAPVPTMAAVAAPRSN
ncbi:MAG: Biotin carboxylase [Modestobacter sp.]|nr:Biotin carboxylase [Modestobacter sp.]